MSYERYDKESYDRSGGGSDYDKMRMVGYGVLFVVFFVLAIMFLA